MIRQATERDVRAMNRLRLQVHENMLSDPNFVTEAMTADAISASGRGWVYEQDRKILGFSIALHRDPSIWALFVHPDHEGRGIGLWAGAAPAPERIPISAASPWMPPGP